jgi:hypothetical protein
MDVTELARLLREAKEHHGRFEATAPPHRWEDWYAAYVVARLGGGTADEAAGAAARRLAALRR